MPQPRETIVEVTLTDALDPTSPWRDSTPGWYWADETWEMHGPYDDREEAVRAQTHYVKNHL